VRELFLGEHKDFYVSTEIAKHITRSVAVEIQREKNGFAGALCLFGVIFSLLILNGAKRLFGDLIRNMCH
jgi:hypothetical protein